MSGHPTWSSRQYGIEFFAAMAAYSVVMIGSVRLQSTVENPALSTLIAATPILPTGLTLWVILRHAARMDELQRRIQSEALAVSAIAAALGTFTYGLMERSGLPPLPTVWFLPIVIACWGLALPIIRRRY